MERLLKEEQRVGGEFIKERAKSGERRGFHICCQTTGEEGLIGLTNA